MQSLTLLLMILLNSDVFAQTVYSAQNDTKDLRDFDVINSIEILCSLQPNLAFCKKLTAPKNLPFLEESDRNANSDSLWAPSLEEYDSSDSSATINRKRVGFLSLDGLGAFDVGRVSEKAAGLTDVVDTVSSLIFPYALLPRLQKLEQQKTSAKRQFDDTDLDTAVTKQDTHVQRQFAEAENDFRKQRSDKVHWYSEAYSGSNGEIPTRTDIPQDSFNQIKDRTDLLSRTAASKTLVDNEDTDDPLKSKLSLSMLEKERALHDKILQELPLQVRSKTLSGLGLKQEEVQLLCKRFEPIAAEYCYRPKIDPQFVEKCRGYTIDCISNTKQLQNSPLATAANAFSSSVGATYNYFGINGIPYYAVNDEGSIDGGQNGKVDFGSWGGGYTDNVNIRDYFRQKSETGGNWYQGLYGYKTGWSVPIVEQFGVEGGGGTQASIPLNEHQFGTPLGFSTGYHVGPYIGVLNDVGVDWYKGIVSTKRAFASPIAGVSGSSSSGFAFPSLELFMKRFGLDGFSAAETGIPSLSSANEAAPSL